MGALGQDGGFAIDGGALRRGRRPARSARWTRRCSPSTRVIDSHTHLDRGPAPEAELVAAAREAGVTRMLTVGTDPESSRHAIARRDRPREVFAAVGLHPNEATGYDDAVIDELRGLARHPKCRAIGETGLDYYRDYAPRADQERAFAAQIALARETGKPLVIHTRAAEDDTIATLDERAGGRRGDPALLLDARPARRVPRARLVDLVRRQRHLPQGAGPRRRGRARAARPHAGGDRRART